MHQEWECHLALVVRVNALLCGVYVLHCVRRLYARVSTRVEVKGNFSTGTELSVATLVAGTEPQAVVWLREFVGNVHGQALEKGPGQEGQTPHLLVYWAGELSTLVRHEAALWNGVTIVHLWTTENNRNDIGEGMLET